MTHSYRSIGNDFIKFQPPISVIKTKPHRDTDSINLHDQQIS
jgi:hypothetical protein